MALEDNGAMNPMVMPVAPMNGVGYGGNGMFGNGDSWAWIILLLLLVGNNGWGGNGNAGMGGGIYPWMNQADRMSDVQTQLCNGFAGVTATATNGFANAEAAASARQMALMQQLFQGFSQIGTQFSDSCCENRLASANLQSVIQAENCADRTAVSDGVRDILTAINAGFQRMDEGRYQDKIDAKNEEIASLRTQLNMTNLAVSQGAQTAQLIADNNAQTAQLIQRIAPYPVPSWTVPNPYAYGNAGCGYGCCNA